MREDRPPRCQSFLEMCSAFQSYTGLLSPFDGVAKIPTLGCRNPSFPFLLNTLFTLRGPPPPPPNFRGEGQVFSTPPVVCMFPPPKSSSQDVIITQECLLIVGCTPFFEFSNLPLSPLFSSWIGRNVILSGGQISFLKKSKSHDSPSSGESRGSLPVMMAVLSFFYGYSLKKWLTNSYSPFLPGF